MAKPSMHFIATTSNKLPTIPVKAGQMIFAQDTRIIYLDTDSRVTYQAIINVVDEATRQAIESPLQGYYYVRKENTLWSYFDNTWTQMTGQSSVVFTDGELPMEGEEEKLYVNDTKLYRWDETKNAYVSVGGDMTWEQYQNI